MTISAEEKRIMEKAIENVMDFGGGIITASQRELKINGYEWTNKHEAELFRIARKIGFFKQD